MGSLMSRGLSRTYDPDYRLILTAAICMNGDDNRHVTDIADRQPSFFIAGGNIHQNEMVWIIPNPCGIFEGNAVLALVDPVLAVVPFKSHDILAWFFVHTKM
jgi:hypothetical protein